MNNPKTIATSIGLVMITATSAVALNVGIVRATSESDVGSDETVALAADGSPLVVTLMADEIPTGEPTTSLAQASAPAHIAAPTPPPAPTAAPTPTPAPTAAPTPTPAPTAAPTSAAAQAPSTTYESFQVGDAGQVLIANHGNSLEFWSATPANGWEYQVEKAQGREIKVEFRGNGELEWKAKLEGGSIKIELSGGGGGDDDDDEDEEDDD